MSLLVRPVAGRKELNSFIYLPEKLHSAHQGWVPPLWSDDRRVFDPRRNLSHRYCDCSYALAWLDGRPQGRVAAIVNHRYNQYKYCRTARFGYLESNGSIDVTRALLAWAEDWAKKRGMERIVGPMGFTEEDPEGMLIDGFDQVPNLATYQNFPWLPGQLEQLGYAKEVDYTVYQIDLRLPLSPIYSKMYERASRSVDFHLIAFTTKAQIKAYIRRIFALMNNCFVNIYGYSPLEAEEMDQLASRYLPLVDPRFIKVAVNARDEVVGFILGIPSLAEGLVKARGRLFPTGIFHILKARRNSTKLDTYIGAVKEEYRHRGVDILLGHSIMEEARKAGFTCLDGHHQLELNTRIRTEMEFAGGRIAKRYRIYHKELA